VSEVKTAVEVACLGRRFAVAAYPFHGEEVFGCTEIMYVASLQLRRTAAFWLMIGS
jgi:hypothetical protein